MNLLSDLKKDSSGLMSYCYVFFGQLQVYIQKRKQWDNPTPSGCGPPRPGLCFCVASASHHADQGGGAEAGKELGSFFAIVLNKAWSRDKGGVPFISRFKSGSGVKRKGMH